MARYTISIPNGREELYSGYIMVAVAVILCINAFVYVRMPSMFITCNPRFEIENLVDNTLFCSSK